MSKDADVGENGSVVFEGGKWTVRKYEGRIQQMQIIVVLPVYLQ